MELLGSHLMAFVEAGGLLAPVLFISFHLLRPFFFLPVIFICISGGVLFGAVAGTFYSIIGITLSSILFYAIINWMPKTFQKLVSLKQKIFGKHATISTSQVALLRLVPFIHFHILSLCLIEMSSGIKQYAKSSLLSNIPFAVVYTSIGQWLSILSPLYVILSLVLLLPLVYLTRKKEVFIKWHEFFEQTI